MRSEWLRRRVGVLAETNFRRFYTGYVTSLLGSSMSMVAIAWAVLGGVLVAFAGPAVVVAVDAASYLASVLALSLLRLPGTEQAGPGGRERRSLFSDMAEGWLAWAAALAGPW